MSGWKRWVVLLTYLGCALFLVFHFVAVFLFVAPRNAISAMSAPVVEGYINPYFRQNWELFAPDPVDYNSRVLVRAKVRDSGGAERQTGWLDITAPQLDIVRGTALPRRIARLVGGGRQMMADARVQPSAVSGEAEAEAQAAEARQPPDPAFQALAVRHLTAIATMAARARWGDGVTAVQVRITTDFYPRFADRNSADDTTSHSEFAWWKATPVTAEAVELWREAHE
ncbi:DUF5819 family protein [Microtetraspora sp. NBRC 13810]|uniref:DUF5819 family protein n=1 Tax=Microtetraspora sp. NBRC 13810 TaxID=3030990 RepID=UPI0025549027|nr:DUF5819 family protein [Microtetraspora sp. NBRC 13810]